MSELKARAKTVIKVTDKVGTILDITIPKGQDIIAGINYILPYTGSNGIVYIGTPQNEWISVEGELPNYREEVLILVNGDLLNVGQYENKYEGCWIIGNSEMLWDYDFNHSYEAVVTHWMHKPKLPKEENKQ